MASGRYDKKNMILNDNEMYKQYLDKTRGLKQIVQHRTPKFKYPSQQDIIRIPSTPYRWSVGDRFYKLANLQYGDPEMWWVIAMYNQTPTEAFVRAGDVIYIPTNLDEVLAIFLDEDIKY
tara:strand:+ start:236 stop:595 length:360 start_codon:yes stop_codon:yes gene_type:complete